MAEDSFPRRWWLAPLLFLITLVTVIAVVCSVSAVAREVLSQAGMLLVGAMATPFILESTVALLGLALVVAINQWRLQKEGDGWVYLAQTEPDAASVTAGAETPTKRLEGVILPTAPDGQTDLNARLAMIEGFLELGLTQEALDHLHLLSADEQQDPRAVALKAKAVM